MTDIIQLFLDSANVVRLERELARAKLPVGDCGARGMMVEFVQGPMVAGLYDIWPGTDVDLFIMQMNDGFIEYARRMSRVPHAPDVAREMRARLDPFVGADKWCSHGRDDGERARSFGFRAVRAQDTIGADRSSGAVAQALYERTERDQAAVVHLMKRDDEADDIGFVEGRDVREDPVGGMDRADSVTRQERALEDGISAPRAAGEETPYHMAVLDAQMSALNPKGSVTNPRPRVGGFIPISGAGPSQSRRGRVTLDDARWLARDGFARDSKGCMVGGWHELPPPFTCR